MEGLEMTPGFWRGKRVFLTGHTGFKGGWMGYWLNELGAEVYGYALGPPTEPNFFSETRLQERLSVSTTGDVLDLNSVTEALRKAKPDVVIHMAAQSLVRNAYQKPVETFSTNVMGTLNLLEASRRVGTAKVIINITSDKCYENKEWPWPYRENDRLGGDDPYSASKACAEIVTAAYRQSFFMQAGIHLASVRAGNVIGGGDWASDRLVPDFLRALDTGQTLKIRFPDSVRPWQHVLEPISGYLLLAERLYNDGETFAGSWNFGPNDQEAKRVGWVVDQLCALVPNARWVAEKTSRDPNEARVLRVDISKAKDQLGWSPRWTLEKALHKTLEWHQAWLGKEDMGTVCSDQIKEYVRAKQIG
jgi:CDP-glucose 4,6-dehydratase